MVLERDQKMLDWLKMFKLATTQQINDVSYQNMKVCYRRLDRLYKDGLLKREKNALGLGYVYSTERIRSLKQARHCFIRNDFYFKLREHATITDCYTERLYGKVKPDMTVVCKRNGKTYFFLVEVETNSNRHKVNIDKYHEFFLSEWRNHFKVKPTIIYVADKDIKSEVRFKHQKIDTKLNNFNSIFTPVEPQKK